MKKLFVIILSTCAITFAQQSPLGLTYPMGVPENAVTGSAAAMGGAGVGIADENFGAALNIANAGMDGRAAFSALVSFDITSINDNGNTATVYGYAPKLLSLIIPVGAAGNLAFAMQNKYNANLNFISRDTLPDANRPNEITGSNTQHISTVELHRLGGLTAWQLGWAKRFRSGVAIGVGWEHLIFNSDSRNVFESRLHYNDLTRDSSGTELNTSTSTFTRRFEEERLIDFASNALRLGFQYTIDNLTIGVAGSYIFTSDENATQELRTRQNDRLDSLTNPENFPNDDTTKFTVDLPPSLSFGLSYSPNDRLLLAADFGMTLWELFEVNVNRKDGIARDIRNIFGEDIRNTYAFSLGARFVPAGNQVLSRYHEQIAYSAGFRYEMLPHSGGGGLTDAYEYAFTFGLGLPIPNDGGLVDFVFQVGRREDSRFDGYAENVYKIQLGLNGGRSWFQRGEN